MLHSIPGSRGEGSDLPGYHQTTKVTLTESSPERSGYMHIDKQVTLSILVMLFSSRGTKTAKVEGLWLVNSTRIPRWQPQGLVVLSFYSSLPLYHKRSSWCRIMMSWSSALILQWKNHCTCALELPWFVCISASIHTSTPNITKAPNLFISFLTQFSCLWHSPLGILVCPYTGV